MTGALDFFTASRSGDILSPSFGSILGSDASFVARAARASGVQLVPVITAAAPITALRMRNERRSTPVVGGGAASGVVAGVGVDPLTVSCVVIVLLLFRVPC